MSDENMNLHGERNSVLVAQHASMLFRIADVDIELLSIDSRLKIGLEGAMKGFIVEEGKPDIRVQAGWSDLSGKRDGELVFDSGDIWKLYSENGSCCFWFTSPIMGAHPYKMATFTKEFDSGEVYLHHPYFDKNQSIYPLEYPLDELMINNFLARGKGVEVHACGVLDSHRRGHLFVGQSGAGKSTIGRIWQDEPGVTILSDDRIILRRMENKIWMYGTPWHGDAVLACPTQGPLTRVYFLSKGMKNELIPHRNSDGLGRLFVCSFPPFYCREGLDFTLSFLEDVVKNVPCYELKFKPDKGVVEFITSNE